MCIPGIVFGNAECFGWRCTVFLYSFLCTRVGYSVLGLDGADSRACRTYPGTGFPYAGTGRRPYLCGLDSDLQSRRRLLRPVRLFYHRRRERCVLPDFIESLVTFIRPIYV